MKSLFYAERPPTSALGDAACAASRTVPIRSRASLDPASGEPSTSTDDLPPRVQPGTLGATAPWTLSSVVVLLATATAFAAGVRTRAAPSHRSRCRTA